MIKTAAKLYPGVSYRQVVLTLPSQLGIPFYQHRNHNQLYAGFMKLAEGLFYDSLVSPEG